MDDRIKVCEIFGPTIQGEGILIGQPTVFVRTGGCDFRCAWCDTLYAVDASFRHQWRSMDARSILMQVEECAKGKPITVSLSGGNPAIQPLEPLITAGQAKGYRFAMETQGSVFKDWFGLLETLVVSPKPPSSKMRNNWENLEQCFALCGPQTIMKIPILNEEDYLFSRDISRKFPHVPVYLQPVNHTPAPLIESGVPLPPDQEGILKRFRWLINRVMEDQWYEVRLLPQLHVFIWGNLKGV